METNETLISATNVVADISEITMKAIQDPHATLNVVIDYSTKYGFKLIMAILVLVIGRFVARFLREAIKKGMSRAHVDEALTHFSSSLAYVAMMTFVIIAALGQLGIQTTSFVAVLGAATFAIGLALQGSLANFAAGVMMLIFKPFTVGNYIEGGGVSGTVSHIDIFTTILKTPDNKTIIIPNAKLTSDNIINYSTQATRRVEIMAGCGYDDDIRKVKACLLKMTQDDNRVLSDPAAFVGIKELGDSSVNFVIRVWVKSADYWNVYFDLTEQIKLRFDEEGFNIPYPQQDLHIYNESNK